MENEDQIKQETQEQTPPQESESDNFKIPLGWTFLALVVSCVKELELSESFMLKYAIAIAFLCFWDYLIADKVRDYFSQKDVTEFTAKMLKYNIYSVVTLGVINTVSCIISDSSAIGEILVILGGVAGLCYFATQSVVSVNFLKEGAIALGTVIFIPVLLFVGMLFMMTDAGLPKEITMYAVIAEHVAIFVMYVLYNRFFAQHINNKN